LFEWFFFDVYVSHEFNVGVAITDGSGLLAVLVVIGMPIWRSRQSRLVTTMVHLLTRVLDAVAVSLSEKLGGRA